MFDGMKTMTHRTTFALDEATASRLRRLASLWRVSQAEVVRRAVADAETASEESRPDPIALLAELHASGQGLAPEVADSYLREVREDREEWRSH